MIRPLQKIGNSKGLVMPKVMLDHLGVTDEVEVLLEEGKVVITAPKSRTLRRESFEEASEATFMQYDAAMKRLSEPG